MRGCADGPGSHAMKTSERQPSYLTQWRLAGDSLRRSATPPGGLCANLHFLAPERRMLFIVITHIQDQDSSRQSP
jgi:hypothetical protein